ncbi:hypothetical protein [Solirubrobacter soli]|uniref:hypothetical protein n=1 Tax=Solirubrobacter soli TaxID=363832 RepID=UPI000482A47F|nr:hypothetical protein [Solirubrobacter soli]
MRRLATIVMALALGLSLSACDPREWFVCSLGLCGYALDDVAPATPRDVVAVAGDRRVTLSWKGGGEPDLSVFNVYRATSADGPFTNIGTTLEPGLMDGYMLANGTTYLYRVTASDAAGNESPPSVVASAVPAPPPPRPRLGAPVLRVSHFFDSIKLDWDGVAEAREYVVYRRTTPDGAYAELTRTGASFVFDEDVVGGTLYRYVVAAVDSGGAIGEPSNEVALSIYHNPGPELGFLLAWGELTNPRGIAVSPARTVYVTDNPGELGRVQRFSSGGALLGSWTLEGYAYGVAVGPDGTVFVVNRQLGRVEKYTATGGFVTSFGSLSSPTGIAADHAGNVYVADTGNARIAKFTSAGAAAGQWAAGAVGVATDADGNVYAVSRAAAQVSKYTGAGVLLTAWGSAGTGDSQFSLPEGIGVDSAARVFVTDTGNDRIEMFNTAGVLTYAFGSSGTTNGRYQSPIGVAGDCAANLYVLDSSRVQKFGPATPTSCPAASVAAAKATFRATMTTTASTRGTVTRSGATTRERGARASGRFAGSAPRAGRAFRAFAHGSWRARYDIAMTGGTGTAKGVVVATGARRARLCLAFTLRVSKTLEGSFSTLAGPAAVGGSFTETLGQGFRLKGVAAPGRRVRRSLPARCRALVSG